MNENAKQKYRYFLKDSIRKSIDFRNTDQSRGLPPPPLQKPVLKGQETIDLVIKKDFLEDYSIPISQAIEQRQSVRSFREEPLTLKELSFLLWATQGVRRIMGGVMTLRTVPSAGSRHSFETYLFIRKVEGLREGIYRYLPLEHQLAFEFTEKHLGEKISQACFGQRFVSESAATFFWSTIPSRMEWRYDLAAHRVIALDAGHVCQNLYLACEAINAGTCAIGAYDQEFLDSLLRLDGTEEFVI
ncbi:MAG: SagB/ThcOx family dehydrogenase, partial [Acidobacteriota bacterium]